MGQNDHMPCREKGKCATGGKQPDTLYCKTSVPELRRGSTCTVIGSCATHADLAICQALSVESQTTMKIKCDSTESRHLRTWAQNDRHCLQSVPVAEAPLAIGRWWPLRLATKVRMKR